MQMGYYKDRNTNEIFIDDVTANIVRKIFQKYIEEYGLTTIARNLNNRGIKSPEYFSHRKIGAQRSLNMRRNLSKSPFAWIFIEFFNRRLFYQFKFHFKFIYQSKTIPS